MVSFAGKLISGMKNEVQNTVIETWEKKEAFLNVNKIITTMLLTDGFPLKTLNSDTDLKKQV